MKLKDLKKGDYFTFYKFSDINSEKFYTSSKEVYTDFIF